MKRIDLKNMDIQKKIACMRGLRWLGAIFGVIMYFATEGAFGFYFAVALGIAATLGFFHICDKERRRIMCQFVADDIRAAVNEAGHNRCIVEIKSINAGIIMRVYLVGAGRLAINYNRAIMERIKKSWYRKDIWVTQILELDHESELEEAHEYLDKQLMKDLRRIRDEKSKEENRKDK